MDTLAGRSIRWELTRLGWAARDLADPRKSDPAKLKLAARLRTETTLTLKAITRLVHLGTSKRANIRLHEWMAKPDASAPTPGPPQ